MEKKLESQSLGTKAPEQQNEGPEQTATHFLLLHSVVWSIKV